MRKLGAVIGMLAAWNVLSQAVAAEKHYGPGVTDTEIKIGQVMPYSGPEAPFGVMGRAEAAYFKMVNEHGGVNGRRIGRLVPTGTSGSTAIGARSRLRR